MANSEEGKTQLLKSSLQALYKEGDADGTGVLSYEQVGARDLDGARDLEGARDLRSPLP